MFTAGGVPCFELLEALEGALPSSLEIAQRLLQDLGMNFPQPTCF